LTEAPFRILSRPHVRHKTGIVNQLRYFKTFCAKIRTGLDQDDINARREKFGHFDIRGKIAIENG